MPLLMPAPVWAAMRLAFALEIGLESPSGRRRIVPQRNGFFLRRIRACDAGSDSLAGNAPGDADTDTKGAANVSRFHTVYDGSSGSLYISRFGAGQGLLSTLNVELLSILIGSKVKRFRVATRIAFPQVRRSFSRSWR